MRPGGLMGVQLPSYQNFGRPSQRYKQRFRADRSRSAARGPQRKELNNALHSCSHRVHDGSNFTTTKAPDMKIFLLTDNTSQEAAWAERLRELDHKVHVISIDEWGTPGGTPRTYQALLRGAVAASECVVVGNSHAQLGESQAFAAGLAEGLGIQVIVVDPFEGGVVAANPRNVRYSSFSEAVARYFSTGRAMAGERALG